MKLSGVFGVVLILTACGGTPVYVPNPAPICACFTTANTLPEALMQDHVDKCNEEFQKALDQVKHSEEGTQLFLERYQACQE